MSDEITPRILREIQREIAKIREDRAMMIESLDRLDTALNSLSGASGKLSAIPWAANSLLHTALLCDRCRAKCRPHLADAPLSAEMRTLRSQLNRLRNDVHERLEEADDGRPRPR
jgi:hypothetical protein